MEDSDDREARLQLTQLFPSLLWPAAGGGGVGVNSLKGEGIGVSGVWRASEPHALIARLSSHVACPSLPCVSDAQGLYKY